MLDSITSEVDQDALLLGIYELAPHFVRGQVARQDIEDVVHDIALEWLIKLRSGNWATSPDNFQAFVRALVKNHVIDRRRSRRRAKAHDGEYHRVRTAVVPAWVSPDRSNDEDVHERIRRELLRSLPPRCKSALRLVREEGVTYKEAAELLGISTETVRTHVARGEKKLRARLKDLGFTVSGRHVA